MNRDKKVIMVRDMVKKFGDFTANDHLTFDVSEGEIFGFLGANGAGKTTALRILCGLSLPSSGEILVAGYNIYTQREKIKKSIGYMSQKFSLYEDLTAGENVDLFAGLYGLNGSLGHQRKKWALSKAGLADRKNTLTRNLSAGHRQRLAVFHGPSAGFDAGL